MLFSFSGVGFAVESDVTSGDLTTRDGHCLFPIIIGVSGGGTATLLDLGRHGAVCFFSLTGNQESAERMRLPKSSISSIRMVTKR